MAKSLTAMLSRGFTAVALAVTALTTLSGQQPIPSAASLAQPYHLVEGWAKMPAGRNWGAPAAVEIDPDGKSLWVFERCGKNTCADSALAPMA